MAFGKCEKCEQSDKVKQSGKWYILPLFFLFTGLLMLAYERDPGNASSVITVWEASPQLPGLSGLS